ncbi:replication fork protection component Swi3-domain-containing protein [Staphylotrichum tortipilum]|uniref:Chromosome segregation in meiosis protein n=1 Tax=Staphylotrichum tortipilum TaxID=2831512 RepID=A0AAN6MDZ2_9PEZI|nr:replication fork protection component Swi3-domain-containing protein [Staphylotrichum longicolle]
MPSKTASKPTDAPNRGTGGFVDDYLADWDNDDPFRSPSPEPARNTKEPEKKTDTLGIDQELDLKKKPRVPRVKLDETRLLSDRGIPKLRKMAPRIRFKGKGHEFSDAARLLSFYQEWLDDLFPKATFLDALAMVEKTGHKAAMRKAREQWIDEGKPKPPGADDDDDEDYRIHQGTAGPSRVAPVFEAAARAAAERAKTPAGDDLFGDEDIYDATPRRSAGGTGPAAQLVDNGVPDEGDLDALMAEAELGSQPRGTASASAPRDSIFGNGARNTAASRPAGEPDDDDLDALMAEAETQEAGTGATAQSEKDKKAASPAQGGGFEDDEEAMAELDGLW